MATVVNVPKDTNAAQVGQGVGNFIRMLWQGMSDAADRDLAREKMASDEAFREKQLELQREFDRSETDRLIKALSSKEGIAGEAEETKRRGQDIDKTLGEKKLSLSERIRRAEIRSTEQIARENMVQRSLENTADNKTRLEIAKLRNEAYKARSDMLQKARAATSQDKLKLDYGKWVEDMIFENQDATLMKKQITLNVIKSTARILHLLPPDIVIQDDGSWFWSNKGEFAPGTAQETAPFGYTDENIDWDD